MKILQVKVGERLFVTREGVVVSFMKSYNVNRIGFFDKKFDGFSLLEMSIALVIIGILSYTISLGVQSSRDYDKYVQNAGYLEDVRQGLLTFVQSNGYLPCPDTDGSGTENRTADVCSGRVGQLPFQMIGVNRVDSWNNPLYYAINERADTSGVQEIADATGSAPATYFNSVSAPLFNLNTLPIAQTHGGGNLTVCGETLALPASLALPSNTCAAGAADADKVEITAVAVVVSFGKNGTETWAGQTLGYAETENFDGDTNFWKAQGTNVEGQSFDDQLIWLTGFDVKYALISSERGLQ